MRQQSKGVRSRGSQGSLPVAAAAFVAALGLALTGSPRAQAQFSQPSQVPQAMVDSPALKPPPGANVAIVEFSDLECPACAAANPALISAMDKYHVPWMRHDFPLPQHSWSFQAAVNARWFDEKSLKLGDAYRNEVFQQQQSISTGDDLNQLTQKFAQAHGTALPFVVDPQGKLADAVRADKALGQRLGVHQTPTIWVVTAHSHDPGHPFVQVTDVQLLYSYLDQALAATSTPAGSKSRAHGTR